MADVTSALSLITAQYTFDAMVAAMTAAYARPPVSSLAQSQEESAAIVVPLLQAASSLVGVGKEPQ